jgi:hypothetical protein
VTVLKKLEGALSDWERRIKDHSRIHRLLDNPAKNRNAIVSAVDEVIALIDAHHHARSTIEFIGEGSDQRFQGKLQLLTCVRVVANLQQDVVIALNGVLAKIGVKATATSSAKSSKAKAKLDDDADGAAGAAGNAESDDEFETPRKLSLHILDSSSDDDEPVRRHKSSKKSNKSKKSSKK